MNQTIFLPSDDETRQLMEHAWQEFQQQAGTQGDGTGSGSGAAFKYNRR